MEKMLASKIVLEEILILQQIYLAESTFVSLLGILELTW